MWEEEKCGLASYIVSFYMRIECEREERMAAVQEQ